MTRREVIELILKMKGGKAARRDVKGVRTEFKGLGSTLSGLRAGIAGIAGIGVGVVVKQLFDAGVEVQRFNRQMQLAAGSSANAAREIAWLRKTAYDLGQEFYTIRPAYAEFLETTKGTELAGRRSHEIFQGLLEGVTALNKGTADTEGILRALVQMISKGNVQAEELRGQLGERLPGAFNLAAEAMGVSTKELNKMLEQGEVAADVLLPRLARMLHEKYGQAALDASNDAQQGMNRFTTSWKDLKANIAQAGFMDAATAAINDLSEAIKDPDTIKTLTSLSGGMLALADVSKKTLLPTLGLLIKILGTFSDLYNKLPEWARNAVINAAAGGGPLRAIVDIYSKIADARAKASAVPDDIYGNFDPNAEEKTFSGPAPGTKSQSKKAASEAAKLEARIKRLNAWTDTQIANLDSLWDQGLVSLQDYFNQRYNLITKQYQEEIAALKALAAAEGDPDKKLEIQTEIYERQQQYEQDLIDLAKQRSAALSEVNEKQQEINDLIEAAQERAQGAEYGAGRSPYNLMGDMEDENQRYGTDIADMESRHEEELEALAELYEGRMELDEEYAQYKRDLDNLSAAHSREKEAEKLAHEKKVAKLRVKLASQTAGMLAETMHNLYVATGENNKQLLALYQAAAAAEVAISTAAAIMKAYEESGPYMGTVWAVYLTALGAAQIASIYAQKLAYGGPVGGHSPNDRADNVPIMATAGEYMIQRPSAGYYGRRIMDAINNAMIPRGVMENILTGAHVPSFEPAYALATGGPVPAAAGGSTVIGDVHMTVQARDAQSFADNPEMVADTFKKAVRLGMLRGVLS